MSDMIKAVKTNVSKKRIEKREDGTYEIIPIDSEGKEVLFDEEDIPLRKRITSDNVAKDGNMKEMTNIDDPLNWEWDTDYTQVSLIPQKEIAEYKETKK